MKKNLLFFALLTIVTTAIFTICIVLFSACVKVTDITLNKKELILVPGDTETLIATVLPANANHKEIIWKSSNTTVAAVTDNGLVTAIANGKTTITSTTKDGKKTVSCAVNVDYRNRWVGDWDFTSVYYVETHFPPGIYEKTYQYAGKIEFGNTDSTILVSHTEDQTCEMIVNNQGKLHYYPPLEGSFIGTTDVSFQYKVGQSPMYTAGWRVTGKSKK